MASFSDSINKIFIMESSGRTMDISGHRDELDAAEALIYKYLFRAVPAEAAIEARLSNIRKGVSGTIKQFCADYEIKDPKYLDESNS